MATLPASAQTGGSAVPFLLISADARACGMGEVGTAMADNLNAIYWNPGTRLSRQTTSRNQFFSLVAPVQYRFIL
ncbi:MAG: hypothetical protein IPK11_15640 [Ignavibacteria bacterium]|nr:hypothetical protein [Ignavibacteria bacterium]